MVTRQVKSMRKAVGERSGNKETNENKLAQFLKPDLFQPEDFLLANEKISILSLGLLKDLYDLTKSCENKGSLSDILGLQTDLLKAPISTKTKKRKKIKLHGLVSKAEAPVSSLITENFDEGQIWEEVELQNGLMHDTLVTSVSKLLAYQKRPVGEQDNSDLGLSSSDEEHGDNQVLATGGKYVRYSKNAEDDEDSDFFETDENYKRTQKEKAVVGKQYPKSVVDDQFFNLAQMTEHIEQVEAQMEKVEAIKAGKMKDDEENADSSSDDEDRIDLFEDIPSEDDEGEKREAQYFYQDFFDPPLEKKDDEHPIFELEAEQDENKEVGSDEDEDQSDDETTPSFDKKSVKFNLEEDEGDEVEKVHEDQDTKSKQLGTKINETLSSFEKRKKKIEDSIEEIENRALQPKSWQLLGEATAENRPENALLEEHLVYDHLIRPAPEITAETTMKLEDVILQRIKDGAWDDVQRKVRPIEDPREYKKRLVLDAEKSKASLADIYEQEYLAQKRADDGEVEEKEPEEHLQIRKELQSLFQKLDALSHFHFTPKAPKADVKIVSNMPSISIEETSGVGVSDANMLAPQEIQGHAKGAIKGKAERTDTDRKRERRKKKKQQHLKRLMQEDKARQKGLGLRNIKLAEGIVKSQQKKMKEAEAASGSGDFSYSTSKQNSKELKSSKAFFSKLQESVSSHIDKVAKRKKLSSGDAERISLSAKKFKL